MLEATFIGITALALASRSPFNRFLLSTLVFAFAHLWALAIINPAARSD